MASLNTVKEVVQISLDSFLPANFTSPESLVMLYAIGLQESRFEHMKQIGGPARGYWQFERGGGVAGVMTHIASKEKARLIVEHQGLEFNSRIIHKALETNVPLGVAFARLLLYTDSKPLPALGNVQTAWDYYIRNWRPGKPHRKTWDEFYWRAIGFVNG